MTKPKSAPDDCLSELDSIVGDAIKLRRNVSPQALSTFGLGAAVPLLAEPESISELQSLLRHARRLGIAWRVLGAGSNVLFPDESLDCLVIRLGRNFSHELTGAACASCEELLGLQDSLRSNGGVKAQQAGAEAPKEGEGVTVTVFGAAALMGLSRRTAKAGLAGLEFAAGIPASLGGAVKMNAGAHGGTLSQVLTAAYVVDRNGELARREAEELQFSYRRSAIGEEEIVVAAELRLVAGAADQISSRRNSCLDYRKQTQPLHLPSAGSVFKNPDAEEVPAALAAELGGMPAAAALLDRAGVKGLKSGGVQFSELHANWLVRVEETARAADALWLMEEAQARVESRFGIRLQREILLWKPQRIALAQTSDCR